MSNQQLDERLLGRIHFDCLVKFEFGDSRLDCELVDISLKGALIHNCTGATPIIDSPCTLVLYLGDLKEVVITMQGIIAHKNLNRIGIYCQQIDLDSMTHLKKLVETNLNDPLLLERELSGLIS